MSCIRFNTPAQRAQLARNAPTMRTPDDIAQHYRSPEVTEGKIRRLRLLAEHPNPKIRESAAASYHTPADVMAKLAADPDPDVRACVARNEHVSCDLLRELADDESEQVRGFVAVNFFVPADVMAKLAEDESAVVRGLVAWKASLADADAASEPQLVEA